MFSCYANIGNNIDFIFIYFCVSLFDIFNLKVFRGNRDGNTVMKHYLMEKLVAKTLRILRHQNSKDFMGSTVCLRAEVYGCQEGNYSFVMWLMFSEI